MKNIITICFGDKFSVALERISSQIESLNNGYIFGGITVSIFKNDKKLWCLNLFFNCMQHLQKQSNEVLYVWTYLVLLRFLKEIKENEVFIYLDAWM